MADVEYVIVRGGVAAEGSVMWDGVTPIALEPGQTLVPVATWSGQRRTVAPEILNDRALRDRADKAIDAMQAHIDRGTFTAAQMTAAMLLVLRVCVALCRLVLGRLDGQ